MRKGKKININENFYKKRSDKNIKEFHGKFYTNTHESIDEIFNV